MASSSTQPISYEASQLPQISMADFKAYNRMAVTMERFHNHFRQNWTMIYNAACTGNRPAGMSMRQFLAAGVQFCSQLAMHHGIEEQYIFPILAKKMPEFQTTAQRKKNGTDGVKGGGVKELVRQHELIHDGMDQFEKYLKKVLRGEEELDMRVLKEKMGWGDVLWMHLDEEVETLGAENMRRYWSLEEMSSMPS